MRESRLGITPTYRLELRVSSEQRFGDRHTLQDSAGAGDSGHYAGYGTGMGAGWDPGGFWTADHVELPDRGGRMGGLSVMHLHFCRRCTSDGRLQ